MKIATLLAALLPLCVLAQQAPVNLALRRPTTGDTSKGKYYSTAQAVDGIVSDKSRYLGAGKTDPHWLVVDLGAETWVGSAHLYSGYGGEATLFNFELQSWDGAAWQMIPGTVTKGNTKTVQAVVFEKPVKTAKIRLLATQCHQHVLRLKEITLWAPQVDGGTPPLGTGVQILDEAAPEVGLNIKTEFDAHPVMVNQSGYNLDWPKRFTAPLAKAEAEFIITPADGSNVLYSGKVLGGVGDFTDFRPAVTGQEYVITVTGGDLKPGRSDPFVIAPL
ncbi:MAG: discoidin domain-containing protein, partial [Kiritimatiellaeota bacterium]|nr:discoidin domain-containing protein [Kiritimatiellota bacterium]